MWMPLDRVTPADIPSQKEMILESLAKREQRQKIRIYTGLKEGRLLKDLAWKTQKDGTLLTNQFVVTYIAGIVKTMLGPRGLDKMFVRDIGEIRPTRKVTITNDAAEVLSLLEFEHPVGRLVADVSKSVDKEIGDGVATTIVLAEALLRQGTFMVKMGLHPNTIAEGYKDALKQSIKILNEISIRAGLFDTPTMEKVAKTTICGKGLAEAETQLAAIAVRAVQTLLKNGKTRYVDLNLLKVEKALGNSITDSELLTGVMLRNEVVSRYMPLSVKDARIAVISTPIVYRNMEKPIAYEDVVFEFENPKKLGYYSQARREILTSIAGKVKQVGANVVFSRKGLDPIAISEFENSGILAVRRIIEGDIEKISLATGSKIVGDIWTITSDDLGYAELVEEKEIGGEKWILIKGCKNPASVSIMLRAPSEETTFEAEHLIWNAIHSVSNVAHENYVVPGAGASFLEIATLLRQMSRWIDSRKALAVEGFANALEEVPKAIIGNSGINLLDQIIKLRSLHSRGEKYAGFNAVTSSLCDVVKEGILDPLSTVRQSLISATELTNMILKVDALIYNPTTKEEKIEKKNREREERGKRPEDWVEEKEY
jgi:chaperonin GroEL (HSP60 family)